MWFIQLNWAINKRNKSAFEAILLFKNIHKLVVFHVKLGVCLSKDCWMFVSCVYTMVLLMCLRSFRLLAHSIAWFQWIAQSVVRSCTVFSYAILTDRNDSLVNGSVSILLDALPMFQHDFQWTCHLNVIRQYDLKFTY